MDLGQTAKLTRRVVGVPVSLSTVVALARRPRLWPTAVAMTRRLSPNSGSSREAFFRFRNQTNRGGDGSGPPETHDLLMFLEWSRKWDRSMKGELN